MKDSEKLEIKDFGGHFLLNPMPLNKGLKLCRKVELMLIKALKAVDALKEPIIDLVLGGSGEVSDEDLIGVFRSANIEKIMEVMVDVFDTMTDDEFLEFVHSLLCSTQYVGDNGAVEFTEMATINAVFAGNIASIYMVLFEVMRYNNFTPFAIGGIGSLMDKIGSSTMPGTKELPSANT